MLKNPSAAFSHVIAAYYAGVGTIGDCHNLITREFGPRVRLVSILTDAPVEEDRKMEEELCIHCQKCLNACPANCFAEGGEQIYTMDKAACTNYHLKLIAERRFPCGICANICPIGDDIAMYKTKKDVSQDGVKHIQAFGS